MAGSVKVRTPQMRRRDAGRQIRESRDRRRNLMIGAAALAVFAVAALVFVEAFLNGPAAVIERAEGVNQHARTRGSETAPVVLTVWEDFQCPFCRKANQEALAEIEKQYVVAGVVRVEYRHFAFLGKESVQAAQASECAAEQHLFWEYHDILFANQAGENRGAFSNSRLTAFAAQAGLDPDAFATCFEGDRYKAAVEAETNAGRQLGVASTPVFFVGDQQITGAQPFGVFKTAIEAELRGR